MADRSERQPNALQNAAAELFNEINEIRDGIAQSRLKFQQWSKAIQKRLNI